MGVLNKYQKFIDRFETDLADLKAFDGRHPEIQGLLDFLLTTDINRYMFLQEPWAGRIGNVSDMLSLFYAIHHAVYDDGAISIVSVNGYPRLVFSHPSDFDSFEAFCHSFLSDAEKRFSAKVELLDISFNDFGNAVIAAELTHLKRCYVHDAANNGIEFANQAYSKYTLFSPDWSTELADKIESRKKLMVWN